MSELLVAISKASEIQPWILPLALISTLSEVVVETPLGAPAVERLMDLLREEEGD
jgi:hypothetical protein